MKFTRTLLAATLLCGSIGANAAITLPSTGDSELFLAAYGKFGTTDLTFVLDTGLSVGSFNQNAAQSFSLGGNSNWTSFYSQLNSNSALSSLRWVVFGAADPSILGTSTIQTVLTTSSKPTSQMVNGNLDASAVNQMATSSGIFINATNGIGTHGSTANGSSLNTKVGANDGRDFVVAAAAADFQSGLLAYSAAGTLNSSMRFASLTGDTDAGDFGLTQLAGNWLLTDSTLSYSVAAIPEPGEWAFMLAGLSLAGMVARRRRAA